MKILFVGEIVSSPGRQAVKEILPTLIQEAKVDVVFANAENLSGGRGFTEENLLEMQQAGIDYFTGGDHIFWQRDTEDYIDSSPVLRPANYPKGTPGKGYTVVDAGEHGQILLINLNGRTSFGGPQTYLDDPFTKVDEILEEHRDQDFAAIVVDMHAEATSEKVAMALYLDGRVTAVLGSHIHLPTADNRALPKGTLYVGDVGMTGNIDSVLGVKTEIILNLLMTARNQRFEWEKAGTRAFRSVLLDTEEGTIVRVDKTLS